LALWSLRTGVTCCSVVCWRGFVELLHERCAGLDIGKKDLKACVRTPSPSGKRSRRQEIRTFAATTNALLELRDWLVAEKVTLVVLEATGDYWRGAFYLLEDCLNVILVNAAHAKGLPGRKTDLLRRGCVRWVSVDYCGPRSCPRSRSGSCGT